MQYYIFVGMDLHDRTMVLKWALDRSDPQSATYGNDPEGRRRMIGYFRGLLAQTRASRVFFAYEASCQGFGLYDQLCDAGFECAVLAPTRMPRSAQARKSKTDPKDAARIVDILRAHVLAGCELPAVRVPALQTRDDREVVRARLDLSHKLVVLKNQVRTAPRERIVYDRIRAKNPRHRKKAVVAIMRRLAVRMWHVGLAAQNRTALPAAG